MKKSSYVMITMFLAGIVFMVTMFSAVRCTGSEDVENVQMKEEVLQTYHIAVPTVKNITFSFVSDDDEEREVSFPMDDLTVEIVQDYQYDTPTLCIPSKYQHLNDTIFKDCIMIEQ